MRSVIKSFVLSVLCVLGAAIPATASAQSLDQILGVVQAGTAYGWNSCSYVNGGLQSALCQTNRAVNVANTLRQVQQNSDWRRQQRFQQRSQQLDALQRACRAGDEQSCARSGGTDPQQMQIARALNDACIAGDKASCRRAEAIMSERNVSTAYRDDRGYDERRYEDARAPRQRTYAAAGQQVCRPVIDPRTGYRVAGQLVCN